MFIFARNDQTVFQSSNIISVKNVKHFNVNFYTKKILSECFNLKILLLINLLSKVLGYFYYAKQ
jgi:hypothetical protein